MRDWFPRHWKCGVASEVVNNLAGIQSVYLLPYHLTEFLLCVAMTPRVTAGCTQHSRVGCFSSELSATSGQS